MPGIRRKKAGESFVYLELQGKPVKDEEKLKRIKAVVIPGPGKTAVGDSPAGQLRETIEATRGTPVLGDGSQAEEGPAAGLLSDGTWIGCGCSATLVAWDNDPREWRTFRADRIKGPAPTCVDESVRLDRPDAWGAAVGPSMAAGWYRYAAVDTAHGRFTVHAPAEFVADRMGPTVAVVKPLGRLPRLGSGAPKPRPPASCLDLDVKSDLVFRVYQEPVRHPKAGIGLVRGCQT